MINLVSAWQSSSISQGAVTETQAYQRSSVGDKGPSWQPKLGRKVTYHYCIWVPAANSNLALTMPGHLVHAYRLCDAHSAGSGCESQAFNKSMQRGKSAAMISQRVWLKMGSGTPGLVVHRVSRYPKIVSGCEMRPLPMATDFNGTCRW